MKKSLPLALLAIITLCCFLSGPITGILQVSATEADILARFQPPSATHWLGTDELGRDLFARLLTGGRVSLTVAFLATLIACTIGTLIGVIAGWRGGIADAALMRLTDFLIALPALPLLIILSAVDIQKLGLAPHANADLYKITLLIALLGWTTVARLARARTLTLKKMEFIRAAKALGVKPARIIWRHILPNVKSTVLVAAALAAGNIILVESALSFLGLGIKPPAASWGNMLSNAQDNIWEHARLAIWPGMMIFITVLSLNFLADAVQEEKG